MERWRRDGEMAQAAGRCRGEDDGGGGAGRRWRAGPDASDGAPRARVQAEEVDGARREEVAGGFAVVAGGAAVAQSREEQSPGSSRRGAVAGEEEQSREEEQLSEKTGRPHPLAAQTTL